MRPIPWFAPQATATAWRGNFGFWWISGYRTTGTGNISVSSSPGIPSWQSRFFPQVNKFPDSANTQSNGQTPWILSIQTEKFQWMLRFLHNYWENKQGLISSFYTDIRQGPWMERLIPVTAAVQELPQATNTTRWCSSALTRVGTLALLRSPWPSWPCLPWPHVNTFPSSVAEDKISSEKSNWVKQVKNFEAQDHFWDGHEP
jgi:hypothetical protein